MARSRDGKRWTPAEARGVLEEWKRSGLPLTRFAKQRGYGPQRLQWWKGKLEARSASSVGLPRFVPVELPAMSLDAGSTRTGSGIEIALPGGVRLRASEGVDARWIGRLVVSLREAGC